MDLSQYRELFLAETREHLQSLISLIMLLEETPDNNDHINALFRSAHSLKGMAASMEYHAIADLAHGMESLMNRVREGEIPFERALATLLLDGADVMEALLQDVSADRPFGHDISPVIQRLSEYSPPPPELNEAGKASHPRPASVPQTATVESFPTIRVKAQLLDRLIDTTGELFTTQQRLLAQSRDTSSPSLEKTMDDLSRLLRNLHHTVMKARLMPFASLSERFPRVVRELSLNSRKEVSFSVGGKDIELDRGLLEEIADPLVHIIRNAVDHGIELPAERREAGKDPFGRIHLSARRDKEFAVISVSDDGKGMDPGAIIASAVAKGLLSKADATSISPHDALQLTCLPGFSTAAAVTEVSGRGVGMDAVRCRVQALGGSLAIESEAGRGTTIRITLPLNVAIINILLASAGGVKCAFPVTSILRTVELEPAGINRNGSQSLMVIDNEEIPVVFLDTLLGCERNTPLPPFVPIIIVETQGRATGVAVDLVIGQKEMHVKPLGRPLDKLTWLSGATVLGDGEIVFVLDPEFLS